MLYKDETQVKNLSLQILIAGRKRDGTVFAHESFVLAWFLRISKHNVWVSQSIFR